MRLTGKCKAIVVVTAIFGVCSLLPLSCNAYTGRVVDVGGSGDLLTISVDGHLRKIRLYGIACPHFGQPFHEKALFMTRHLSLQKNVEITPVFTDNYGIENALVRIQGLTQYINDQLVGYGLAWVKPCSDKSPLCRRWKKLEDFAQLNFVGLWARPPAIAPWEWEKAKRKMILEQAGSKEKKK